LAKYRQIGRFLEIIAHNLAYLARGSARGQEDEPGDPMTTYTLVHVALSLVGIASGFIVLSGLLAARRLDGWTVVFLVTTAWARVYAIGAVVALYLNVFVLVVQAFLKAPALNALAPTQSEPPFLVAQLVVLMLFVGFGIVAARRFRHPV